MKNGLCERSRQRMLFLAICVEELACKPWLHSPYRGGKAGHYGITERVMDGEIRALPVSLHANKDGVSQHLFPLRGPFHCLDPNSRKTTGSKPGPLRPPHMSQWFCCSVIQSHFQQNTSETLNSVIS